MKIAHSDIEKQHKLIQQSKKSDEINSFIRKYSSKHKKLQDNVNILLINGYDEKFILTSTFSEFGNDYSLDNILTAIKAGKKLNKILMYNT